MRDQQCTMVIADGLINMNLNKVIESNHNWKLANDVELLKRLEKFSENIICNASLTLTCMDNLEDNLNETFLRVRTVANKFQAIADNQFIENRVQEEEDYVLANEMKADTDDTRVSPETSKSELLESIRECQTALSRKFETVQVSGIDSEDEMANSSPVVLVPKNVYKERRLPHLIGGEQFIADETLGLMTYSENADDSIESEDDVDETDRASYYSNCLKKSLDYQGETAISSLSSSALQDNLVGSPVRNFGSKVSLEDKSEPVSEDDRGLSSSSNVPVESDLLPDDHCGLFVEKRGLFDERSVLLDTNCESRTPEIEKRELNPTSHPSIEIEKNELSPTSHASVGTTREKLLAGRNFTSFKEDLARVLSNSGSLPYMKIGTPNSVGHENDVSRPVINKLIERCSEDEVEEESKVLPSPMISSSLSTPESSSLITGPAKPLFDPAHGGNIGAVTLPAVSTNTLENLAKGRPKLKGNRRPPSRKHRQGGSLDADSPPANLSVHSDGASNDESASTQPGSNILSPATDEEDLFVLPAYDVQSDPPSRGLFFDNTLLSPGATIDDGGLSTSPLFPSMSTSPTANPESQATKSVRKSLLSGQVDQVDNEVESIEKTAVGRLNDSPTDLFSTDPHVVVRSITKSTPGKSGGSAESVKDMFPFITSVKDGLSSEADDIFSSRSSGKSNQSNPPASRKADLSPDPDLFTSPNVITKLSSSPALFNDWSESGHEAKSGTKSKTSLKSGLQWDLLGSDEYDEDLFRTSKRESRPLSKPEEPTLMEPSLMDSTVKRKNNIFSPTDFEKSKDGMFCDDDAFSNSDIFSDSSSFVRLSLPSNARDSLFASDDDDEDDSLFKTAKKCGTDITIKPSGTSEMKTGKLPSRDSSFRELLKDPLTSMDEME